MPISPSPSIRASWSPPSRSWCSPPRPGSESLRLEVLQGLSERQLKALAPAPPGGEAAVVLNEPLEAVTADQIVRHQERELVGRDRALALMAQGEAARRAE